MFRLTLGRRIIRLVGGVRYARTTKHGAKQHQSEHLLVVAGPSVLGQGQRGRCTVNYSVLADSGSAREQLELWFVYYGGQGIRASGRASTAQPAGPRRQLVKSVLLIAFSSVTWAPRAPPEKSTPCHTFQYRALNHREHNPRRLARMTRWLPTLRAGSTQQSMDLKMGPDSTFASGWERRSCAQHDNGNMHARIQEQNWARNMRNTRRPMQTEWNIASSATSTAMYSDAFLCSRHHDTPQSD